MTTQADIEKKLALPSFILAVFAFLLSVIALFQNRADVRNSNARDDFEKAPYCIVDSANSATTISIKKGNDERLTGEELRLLPYFSVEVELFSSDSVSSETHNMLVPIEDSGHQLLLLQKKSTGHELWEISINETCLNKVIDAARLLLAKETPICSLRRMGKDYSATVRSISFYYFADIIYTDVFQKQQYSDISGSEKQRQIFLIDPDVRVYSSQSNSHVFSDFGRNSDFKEIERKDDESLSTLAFRRVQFVSNLQPCQISEISDKSDITFLEKPLKENIGIYYDHSWGIFVSACARKIGDDSENAWKDDAWTDYLDVKNGDRVMIRVHTKNIYDAEKRDVYLGHLLPPGSRFDNNAKIVRRETPYSQQFQSAEWNYEDLLGSDSSYNNSAYPLNQDWYYEFQVIITDASNFSLQSLNRQPQDT